MMEKAPKRIWADPDHWLARKPRRSGYTEYIREDVSNALIAAAYEASAVVGDYFAEMDYGLMHYPESDALASGNTANEIRTSIRALPPEDARAAYDTAIRAAKIEGMREAAKAAEEWYRNVGKGTPHGEITALIEETEKGQPND
jgi:phage I-like protein